MSEYMDYDDSIYDNLDHKESRAKRIRSWISVILSVIFLIGIVVFVIVRMPKTVRAKFDTVTTDIHTVGETLKPLEDNEFYKLYTVLENGTVKYNDSMKKLYPKAYEIVTDSLDSANQNKMYQYDMNGILIIAQNRSLKKEDKTSASGTDKTEKSCKVMVDVLMVPYSGEGGNIAVSMPIRYTIGCYTGTGTDFISSEYVKSDVFGLNFYSISVKIKSGSGENIKTVDAALKLTDGITKSEAENNTLYEKLYMINGDNKQYSLISGGTRGDTVIEKRLTSGDISTEATIKADFDDVMYRKFESLSVKATKNDTYSISIN
ncbi:MAG: hypothetical protein ACI396_03515 [Acutalibacteraceae bacterium]